MDARGLFHVDLDDTGTDSRMTLSAGVCFRLELGNCLGVEGVSKCCTPPRPDPTAAIKVSMCSCKTDSATEKLVETKPKGECGSTAEESVATGAVTATIY